MEQGKVIIGAELETKSFDLQIEKVKQDLKELEQTYEDTKNVNPFKGQEEDLQYLGIEIEKTRNKLIDLKNKQEQVGKTDFSSIKSSLHSVGNSIEGVIKKVSRWALAVFGIRSAYLFVRSAMSTLTQYDDQLKADIDYMKAALAFALEPIIRGIVNLARQLMFYVGYIVKAWTGKNIFANANKSLEKSVGSAKKLNKEIQKTVAGFDEMNILQSSSTAGGGETGGGITTPSFNFEDIEDMEVPKWIQWIADNKDIVIGALIGIAAALGLIKLGELISSLSTIWSILQPLFAFIGANAAVIAGIILIVGGLIEFIRGIIDYLKDPTWENFSKILLGIALIATGVFLIFGGFPALIVTIIGAVVALGLAIYKNWDKIKETLGKVANWVNKNIIQPIVNLFKGLWNTLANGLTGAFNKLNSFFASVRNVIGNVMNSIYGFLKNIGTTAGNIISSAFKAVINGVLRAIENILNFPIRSINSLIGIINKVPGINLSRLSTFSLPRLARGGIVNNPGNGVFMGNYVAGEKGAEAVLPLTDETFDRLGLAIGRHTSINATIPVYAYNRQVAREIRKIEASQSFAMNR